MSEENDEIKIVTDDVNNVEYIHRLISNQFSILHHSESTILDLAKIASILLGVISFIGIPSLLNFQHENQILELVILAISIGIIIYAGICIVAILLAISSVGGVNLNLQGTFDVSPWWYMDDKMLQFAKFKDEEKRMNWFHEYFNQFKEEILDKKENLYYRETLTLMMLYIRNQHELNDARRMRKLLVHGLQVSIGMILGIIAAGIMHLVLI